MSSTVLLPGLVLGYLVMAADLAVVGHGAGAIRSAPSDYFSHFFEKPWKEMFDGALISVPDMPRVYLPTLFAMKLPEVLLVLGSLGVAGGSLRPSIADLPVRQRGTTLLIALAFLLPVGITVTTRPAMYNGIRHFLFILPPLCVLGGLAGGWLLQRLADCSPLAATAGAVAILSGCCCRSAR